jgi:5'-3' exonuclease
MTPAPLLIADVPWLLYRSYFGLPKSIKGADGGPVGALLGTVGALLAAIEAKGPRAVAACMGAEEARYRVQLYPPYHAHREPMPAELAEQWGRAPELLGSLGWSVVDAGELEADDAMGSLARVESRAGGRSLLLTADRDLYQAVNEGVAVLEMGKGHVLEVTEGLVIERYGVLPEQVPDLIALRGDPSDGIPGAPGVGAKTAAQLLGSHGTLEALLEQAERRCAEEGALGGTRKPSGRSARGGMDAPKGTDEMRPRVARSLHENAQLLRTFKRVATLVEIEVERPRDAPTDFAGGARKARELGMARLAERLERMGDAA